MTATTHSSSSGEEEDIATLATTSVWQSGRVRRGGSKICLGFESDAFGLRLSWRDKTPSFNVPTHPWAAPIVPDASSNSEGTLFFEVTTSELPRLVKTRVPESLDAPHMR